MLFRSDLFLKTKSILMSFWMNWLMARSSKQNCQERRHDILFVGQLWCDLVVVVCVCGWGGAFEFVCVFVCVR